MRSTGVPSTVTPRMTPSRRSPDQVAVRCPASSSGSTRASTRACSVSAAATSCRTTSIGSSAPHEIRATPSAIVLTEVVDSVTGEL